MTASIDYLKGNQNLQLQVEITKASSEPSEMSNKYNIQHSFYSDHFHNHTSNEKKIKGLIIEEVQSSSEWL